MAGTYDPTQDADLAGMFGAANTDINPSAPAIQYNADTFGQDMGYGAILPVDQPEAQVAPTRNVAASNPNGSFDGQFITYDDGSKVTPEQYKAQVEAAAPKSTIDGIGVSISEMLKKNGGEIFVNTMAGSAKGVLNFLAARRKARGDSELQDKKFAYETQTKNAQVARASAMPTLGSMVKPGVTGQRKVGNQQAIAPTPQYTGLINAPRV